MVRTPKTRRKGHTLLELAIVVAILGIIAAMGVGLVSDLIPRYRLVQTARRLEADIQTLRNAAITLGRETRLVLVTGDSAWEDPSTPGAGAWALQVGNRGVGSTTWEYYPPDAEEDGTDDDTTGGRVDIGEGGAQQALGVALAPWDTLSGPGTGNADALVFSPRGWLQNPSTDFGHGGWLTLTLVNKHALAQGVDDHIELRVARSGYLQVVSSLGHEREGSAGTAVASTTEGS